MSIPLSSLRAGEEAVVESIAAGRQATKRLYEMGLNAQTALIVVKNDIGPVLASVNGNKVAVGRGLAEKVLVSRPNKHGEAGNEKS